MATTFIPGYLAALSIATVAIEHVGQSGSLRLHRNVMLKPVAGAVAPQVLSGIETGELSIAGHCTVEDVVALNTMREDASEAAYDFQIGELAGDDAGSYTGMVIVEDLSFDWDAEGGWSFTLDGQTSGPNTYVPGV